MDERRFSKRKPASLFVRFQSIESSDLQYGCFSEDISVDGARFYSPFRLGRSTRLNVNIDIPNNPEITQVEADVKWIGKEPFNDEQGNRVFPVGVEFTYLDNEDKSYLEEFLKEMV
ncbi:MAG: PilZ domain-containing protein [Candidatus Omnitrophota bacterium]